MLMVILEVDFGAGNIELLMQPGQEWTKPAAFLLQAVNPWKIELNFDRSHMHIASVA